MTSIFGIVKHCPADVSMSQVLQLQGCCSLGDPDLETWRPPLLTTMSSDTVTGLGAGKAASSKNCAMLTSAVCYWLLAATTKWVEQ